MATILDDVLSAVKTQLIAGVDNLAAGNTLIADHSGIVFPNTSRYSAFIWWRSLVPTGFPGGMEMKELQIDIALIHLRETDERQRDTFRLTMIVNELHEQALQALQARFLSGTAALDEPLEFIGATPIKIDEKVIRIDQNYRCMYNDFLKDRLA